MMSGKFIATGILLSQFLFPLAVIAEEGVPDLPMSYDILRILKFIARIMFNVFMIAAVGFTLLAAFKYLTAMGNSAKIQEAHKMLFWVITATALGLIILGVEKIIKDILSGGPR